MIPSHALRLQTMLRSMIEVIVPALDPNQPLARDQAQILIGNLRLLADQAGRTHEYEFAELREFTATLGALLAAADGGGQTATASKLGAALHARLQPVAALRLPREMELAALTAEAREAVDQLVAASGQDGSDAFRRTVAVTVLQQAAAQNLRERVWFRAAGLDAAPASLPGLDAVLDPT